MSPHSWKMRRQTPSSPFEATAKPLEVSTEQAIQAGHKIALHNIAGAASIVKYGFPIGVAIHPIGAGEWVHLHNCRSLHDAASSELDLESGARNETRYA